MANKEDIQNQFTKIASQLLEGVESCIENLSRKQRASSLVDQLQKTLPLLQQLEQWTKNLPPERSQTTLTSLIEALDNVFQLALKTGEINTADIDAPPDQPIPPFLKQAVLELGPEITVSNDKMALNAKIPHNFAHMWDAQSLHSALQKLGIVVEIDSAKLQRLLDKPGIPQKVAVGSDPHAGTDATLEDCIGLDQLTGKPTIDETDRADYKEINRIVDISQGQVIFKKEPPTPGTPGIDVFGEPIPCINGVDIPFPTIPNTQTSPDGLSLVSAVDGCLYKENEKIIIVPTLDIQKNVDFTTGNVHASVAVTVQKDVLSDFIIESPKDIIVKGTVEGAKIKSGNSAFLEGGIQGKESALIKANKNVNARFINYAKRVECNGTVTVQGPIIHSEIRCNRLYGEGREAEILGGVIDAGDDVCVEQIGSEIGVKTYIRLGRDIYLTQAKIEKINKILPTIEQKIELYKKSLNSIENAQKKGKKLTPHQEEMKGKIKIQIKKAKKLFTTKEAERDEKETELRKATEKLRTVRVRKTIYPGTEFDILGHTRDIKTPTGPATVMLVGDTIEIKPYQDRIFEDEDEIE